MANKILVLDAGHGFNTAGKQTMNGSRGIVKEWTMNDSVVRKITSILSAYNVTIHRTDDPSGKTDISLAERVRRCNSYKPDLFVSIHENAGGGTGTEVYWHTYGTAEDKKIASIVAPKLASKTGLRNRGVKQAQFAVLGCNATAILVEGGFMDTVSDYEIITSVQTVTAARDGMGGAEECKFHTKTPSISYPDYSLHLFVGLFYQQIVNSGDQRTPKCRRAVRTPSSSGVPVI